MKPVSPVPVGQTNEEDYLQWAKAAGQNLFFFKVAVCFTFMCSCLAFYSYHSVQRQWPPFTLRFAGY